MKPILYIVIPCYNEQDVLPITSALFLSELDSLEKSGKISEQSRILYIDDGSSDKTWELISDYSQTDERSCGIRLSRNRGHQNAVLAGLMEARKLCDITITIDCDGQDDISAMDRMVDAYLNGADIVYGVRSSRETDTFGKRTTAEGYYKLLKFMGAQVVFNHADYRLVSKRALDSFADFHEVNLFLRGLFPMVGYKTAQVDYERHERMAGKTHYPLTKMLVLAADGITSLTIKPIRFVSCMGAVFTAAGFIGILVSLIKALIGTEHWGAAGISWLILLVGGAQLLATGVIGEYIGKTYMETKHRPRYIISERTWKLEK